MTPRRLTFTSDTSPMYSAGSLSEVNYDILDSPSEATSIMHDSPN